MQAAIQLHILSPAKQLTLAALFAALCYVGTAVVQIPAPAGGYLNIGDVFVLLAGWCLGPIFGPIAAATGSALADLIAFPLYAPATFLIKGLDAFIAYTVWALLKKAFIKDKLDPLPRTLAATAGESIMLAGYTLFDGLVGGWAIAVANLPFNLLQAGVCIVGAAAMIAVLYKIKPVRNLFPKL